MKLRNYQQSAINAVYEHLRNRDDNPRAVIPTGGGKTPVIAQLCRDAIMRWNGRVLVLAHVKELLEQTARTLRAIALDLPVGIYSAGLGRRDTSHSAIVAGIQSVFKRACELDAFDLIIVDEARCDSCRWEPALDSAWQGIGNFLDTQGSGVLCLLVQCSTTRSRPGLFSVRSFRRFRASQGL
jgi:type I site-specific restriction endonuclease